MGEHLHYEECCKCGESGQYHHDKVCHNCHEKECSCAEKFLKLADEAWMEVLKEKIKSEIEKKKGNEIENLAEIITKANGEKWRHKISIRTKCDEYKNDLKEYFSSK